MNNEGLQQQIEAFQEELDDIKAIQKAVNSSIDEARSFTENK